jgi:hypothetical protein
MPDHSQIVRVLESARRKLLDTGTRNRLVHVNRSNQRANCLNIINERSDEIFRILRAERKRMRFKAMGKDTVGTERESLLAASGEDAVTDSSTDRFSDNFIETPLGPDALARRLLRLASDSKIAEEEQGINILFLAQGFLRWYEDPSSEQLRESPLVLVPVKLVRNERTSTFDIVSSDDDIATNLPLQERLRQDFGIVLPDIDESETWTPSSYFSDVSQAVSGQARWSLDIDGMQLGFFSFAKILMHRDLDASVWGEEAFVDHPLLRGLLTDGFEQDTPLFGPDDKLDELLDPAEVIQVIDADASQTKVIEEVRRGASLVVQGPPGTGKSQTITNIIAAAAYDGKSVLFVAEKMAALSVVHERLVKCGLRDICLELHSRSANKKALAQELARTLAASAQKPLQPPDPGSLRSSRDLLNRISSLLHTPIAPSNDTPFGTISEIVGFLSCGAAPPSISAKGLEQLDRHDREKAVRAIESFVSALAKAGNPEDHPFRGTRMLDLQPMDLNRLANELKNAIAAIEDLLTTAATISENAQLARPRTFLQICTLARGVHSLADAPPGARSRVATLFDCLNDARVAESLTIGASWAQAYAASEKTFKPAAWSSSVLNIREALVKGQSSVLSRLFGKYRSVSKELGSLLAIPLPRMPTERLEILDLLIDVQIRRKRLADEEGILQSALGREWRGEQTPFAELKAICDWLKDVKFVGNFSSAASVEHALESFEDPTATAQALLNQIATCRASIELPIARLALNTEQAGLGQMLDAADLMAVRETFFRMASAPDKYNEWKAFLRSVESAEQHGAGPVIDAVGEGRIAPVQATQEFLYACAEARWVCGRTAAPELNDLQEIDRHELVSTFQTHERERIRSTKNLILNKHFEQIPRGTMGEMGVIRGEIGRKRGHKPIRWLMKQAGTMVQKIKPVMLMSPISVAQFLPPGSLSFDLLVIDEASQIRPEDALGAITRCKQVVVVGDQMQLPPTSFFDRLLDDTDADNLDEGDETMPVGATAADMESILSLCEARGVRARMLEWHYRSRDPSLIRVSNAEFYQDKLVLPPSPLQLDTNHGLKFRQVPGVYARGGTGVGQQGTNKIEAEAVVRTVAEHARKWPDLSLGVVAFSKAQADMITEILEVERRRDPILNDFLREGRHEDVFVKNIENVQGDERDVILISVGYGPDVPHGRLPSMNFGPINGEGGERRLNVLFSRARFRCEVLASFDPGDLDPSRTRREGPRVLKRYLEFAKTRKIEERLPTGEGADSPFEEDVARAIRSLGYLPDPQVGSTGFRIDIGVRHPERPGEYLLAVECDGAAYHAALWARERDRLRQEILESQGWIFHRIWSTDWFYHRAREVERLSDALSCALSTASCATRLSGSNEQEDFAETFSADDEAEAQSNFAHLKLSVPAYKRAVVKVNSELEPHDAPISQLFNLVRQIVEIEGPIHVDEIARRISVAFGKARTGSRIADVTAKAIRHAQANDKGLIRSGQFIMTTAQATRPPVRDRSAESGTVLSADNIPPEEVVAAAKLVLTENGSMSDRDLVVAVARIMGFQRVGAELEARIRGSLEAHLDSEGSEQRVSSS